jgi:hypothetical protein
MAKKGVNMSDESILDSTKHAVSISPDDPSFDVELLMFINSAFSTLNQLGVGPVRTLSIRDKDANWSEFTGADEDIESVKTYVGLSVRIVFDPPQNSTTMEAFKERLRELEFRLGVASERVITP